MITGLHTQAALCLDCRRANEPSMDPEPAVRNAGSGSASPFSNLLEDALNQTKHLEEGARTAIDGLIAGNGVDVHHAMIAMEKATMAFDLVLAVRNKAVQSYQNVMNMQF